MMGLENRFADLYHAARAHEQRPAAMQRSRYAAVISEAVRHLIMEPEQGTVSSSR